MKKRLPLNSSMSLAEKEKRSGGTWLLILVAFVILNVGSFILIPFVGMDNSQKVTFSSDLSGLYVDSISILLVILYCVYVEKRSLSSIGMVKRGFLSSYSKGLILGITLITLTFVINFILQTIVSVANKEVNWTFILLALFGYFIQGLNEEVVFRGFLMNSIASKKGVTIGVFSNSLFFASLHLLNPNPTFIGFLNIFLAGLGLSLLFYKTSSIWFVGAVHAMWNYFQGPIFGTEVSGLRSFSSILKTTPVAGKTLISGGSFGFEGGLATTFVWCLLIVVTTILIKRRTRKVS